MDNRFFRSALHIFVALVALMFAGVIGSVWTMVKLVFLAVACFAFLELAEGASFIRKIGVAVTVLFAIFIVLPKQFQEAVKFSSERNWYHASRQIKGTGAERDALILRACDQIEAEYNRRLAAKTGNLDTKSIVDALEAGSSSDVLKKALGSDRELQILEKTCAKARGVRGVKLDISKIELPHSPHWNLDPRMIFIVLVGFFLLAAALGIASSNPRALVKGVGAVVLIVLTIGGVIVVKAMVDRDLFSPGTPWEKVVGNIPDDYLALADAASVGSRVDYYFTLHPYESRTFPIDFAPGETTIRPLPPFNGETQVVLFNRNHERIYTGTLGDMEKHEKNGENIRASGINLTLVRTSFPQKYVLEVPKGFNLRDVRSRS